jgi:ABC-type antimicrobial peptide transport system permease subunit
MFFDDLLAYPMQFSASTLVIAIAASVGVGVISAFFPALRASRLNPVRPLTQQ